MSAPRDMKSFVSNLKISGHADAANLTAMPCEAEVDMQANSVPPFCMNSIVSPRSLSPRQYSCMECAFGRLAATARSILMPSSMK